MWRGTGCWWWKSLFHPSLLTASAGVDDVAELEKLPTLSDQLKQHLAAEKTERQVTSVLAVKRKTPKDQRKKKKKTKKSGGLVGY